MTENTKEIFDDLFNQTNTPNDRPADQIVCIVDRSGSMGRIVDDANGGLNEFIENQKQVPGEAQFTLVQFDDTIERVYDRVDLKDVEPYTLTPRGMTALHDAVGQTINDILSWDIGSDTKVIVTVVSDGGENSSREYAPDQIKQLLDQCHDKGWEVVFLAANQDEIQSGGSMGLDQQYTMKWDHSSKGIHDAYATAHVNAASYRSGIKTAGESVRDYQGKTLEDVVNEKTQNGDTSGAGQDQSNS